MRDLKETISGVISGKSKELAEADIKETELEEKKDNDKDKDKEGTLDPVKKDQLKNKDVEDREDDDLDNDGDTDDSDEYLHKRRRAVSKAMQKRKSKMDDDDEDEDEEMDEEFEDEDGEQLDEISSAKLNKYRAANEKDRERLSKEIGMIKGKPTPEQEKKIAKLQSRNKADMMAFKKTAPYLFKATGKDGPNVEAPDAYDNPNLHKSYMKYKKK